MKTKLYIGLVGSLAAGKGVVADYFIKQHGFVSFSLSFIVHDELKKKGITAFTRKDLQDVGDALRAKDGNGALAKRAVEALNKEGSTRVVIEGIRNPGEVEYLRKLPNFILIAVDGTRAVRYKRVIVRGKLWDPKDWKSFLKVDKRDHEDEANAKGQRVRESMNMADFYLENNKDLEHLYGEIHVVIDDMKRKYPVYKKTLS